MVEQDPVVGIYDSDSDLLELMLLAVQSAGIRCAGDILENIYNNPGGWENQMRDENPDIIIIDVPFPYDQNLQFVEHIRGLDASKDRSFILITTNPEGLNEAVGQTGVYQIIGKPFDIDVLSSIARETFRNSTAKRQP